MCRAAEKHPRKQNKTKNLTKKRRKKKKGTSLCRMGNNKVEGKKKKVSTCSEVSRFFLMTNTRFSNFRSDMQFFTFWQHHVATAKSDFCKCPHADTFSQHGQSCSLWMVLSIQTVQMVLSPPYGLSSLALYSHQLCWDTQMCLEVHSVMPKPRLPGNMSVLSTNTLSMVTLLACLKLCTPYLMYQVQDALKCLQNQGAARYKTY